MTSFIHATPIVATCVTCKHEHRVEPITVDDEDTISWKLPTHCEGCGAVFKTASLSKGPHIGVETRDSVLEEAAKACMLSCMCADLVRDLKDKR